MHDHPQNYGHASRGAKSVSIETAVKQVRTSLSETIVAATTDQILILSHEDLATERIAINLKSFLDEHADKISRVDVVAYVRHPLKHYPSAVQQVLKAGKPYELRPGLWKSQHIKRAAAVQSVFGDQVQLRLYGPPSATDWDVVEDFRETLTGMTARDVPVQVESPKVNSSVSAQACAVLAEAAWVRTAGFPTRIARRNTQEYDERTTGRKLIVPTSWEPAILQRNAKAWNALLRRIDIPREVRAVARIPLAPTDVTPSEEEFVGWLRSGLEPEYLTGLAAFCRSDAVRDKPSSVKVADWVETLVRT